MKWLMVLLGGVLFFGGVAARAGDLLSDITMRRQTNNTPGRDISAIVQKYIPPGCSKEHAENYLIKYQFEIHSSKKISADGSQVFIATLDGPKTFFFGFYEETRIVYVVENSKVTKSSGMLVYRGL